MDTKEKFEKVYKDVKALRDALAQVERSVEAVKGDFNQLEKKLVEYEALVRKAKETEEKLAKISMLFTGGGGNA